MRPNVLLEAVIREYADLIDVTVSRDIQEIERRVQNEGLSFLTITLPSFCAALEASLESGNCLPFKTISFKKKGQCTPVFLQGFTRLIFDSDGVVIDNPKTCVAIEAIRQICNLFKKVLLPCSDARLRSAEKQYIDLEANMKGWIINDPKLSKFAARMWSNIFSDFSPYDLIGRHGPGATAERLKKNEKFTFRTWYERHEFNFPSDLHCIPNYGHYDELKKISYLGVNEELPVRVVFVPKTLKTPRVIAIEPANVMYVQQSVMKHLTETIRKSPYGCIIGFDDQHVNKDLAYLSSVDKHLATLDLSEASDRVHMDLVRHCLGRTNIFELLEDSRSLSATTPSGKNIILSKFASMGSACCFPVEAICFFTLLAYAVKEKLGIDLTKTNVLKKYSSKIRVYGDDIIVPTDWLPHIVEYFELFYLKVNKHKTFQVSNFRESCGGDYYKGHDVTPVYCRRFKDPNKRQDPSYIISMVSMSNQFYLKGLWKTCRLIRNSVGYRIPVTHLELGGITYKSVIPQIPVHYWDKGLQTFGLKLLRAKVSKVRDPILSMSGYLTKSLPLIGVEDVRLDNDSSERRGALSLKRHSVALLATM